MRGQRKLRVLLVIDNLNLGGAERQAFAIANSLNKLNDFEVKVTALQPTGNMVQSSIDLSAFEKVKPYRPYSNLLLISIEMIRFSFRLRKLKPDVIISYTIRPNRIVNFIWQLTGATSSYWNQRDDGFGFSNKRDILFMWAFKNVTGYIANSTVSMNALLKQSYKIKSRIFKIENGYEPVIPIHSKEYWKEKLGVSNQLVAVMIANFTKRKDHETVIRAWYHLKELRWFELPKLILVGHKAETFNDLASLIEKFGLSDHIIINDFTDDIAGIISIADFGIHSSFSESMPNAVLEFISYSKIVIASDIDAHCEILGQDYTFLFEPGNFEKLSEAVRILTKGFNTFDWIRHDNYRKFRQHYTIDSMTKKYTKLLNQVK